MDNITAGWWRASAFKYFEKFDVLIISLRIYISLVLHYVIAKAKPKAQQHDIYLQGVKHECKCHHYFTTTFARIAE